MAADLWKESIPPPAVSEDLAPVSDELAQVLPCTHIHTLSAFHFIYFQYSLTEARSCMGLYFYF